jgi:hypothetical protein
MESSHSGKWAKITLCALSLSGLGGWALVKVGLINLHFDSLVHVGPSKPDTKAFEERLDKNLEQLDAINAKEEK